MPPPPRHSEDLILESTALSLRVCAVCVRCLHMCTQRSEVGGQDPPALLSTLFSEIRSIIDPGAH